MSTTDIAVIGLAGRFPGARDVDALWRNLRDGVDAVTRFDDDDLRAAGVADATRDDPRYVPVWGRLDDADLFDAAHFGYSAREATLLDPQQRVLLEVAWHALEDAGHAPGAFHGRVGVYAGASVSTYLLGTLLRGRGLPPGADGLELLVANDKDYLASRISYKLGLTGPAVCVQSACSTSLLAVHLACQALLDDECDMALAGGVTVRFPQDAGYLHQEGMILSPDGRCRPFDARAAGTVAGNGAGLVVLRRLADALADGDRVDAVIRGSAANNDGATKVGYTAPSVAGQASVVAAALAAAGLRPRDVTAVEAHGTGTQLGDPVEVAALTKVWAQDGDVAPGSVTIGSVKSNVGHLDCAAGVTSLVKAVLQVRHGELVPSVHFEEPNPGAGLEGSPFRVATATTPWEPDGPRRIGVSAFGFGGTNVHVVLEQAPPRPAPPAPAAADAPPVLLPVSARDAEGLTALRADLSRALPGQASLGVVARTLQTGRRHERRRDAVVAADLDEAARTLADPGRAVGPPVPTGGTGAVWLLPGQGSQHPGMAAGLHASDPGVAADVDACLELFAPEVDADLRGLLLDRPATPEDASRAAAELARTAVTQPALFVVEIAVARLLLRWGLRPAAMLGHSVGELAAACLAGVLDLPGAVRVVAARGRLLDALPTGAMLSVAEAASVVAPLLPPEVEVAADNGPHLCVVSGPHAAVDAARAVLDDAGVASRRLHTSHAYHSAMVEPALAAFRDVVAGVPLHAPRLPYLTGVTGDWVTAEQATDPEHYVRHLRRTVLFGPALRRAVAEGVGAVVEVGPGTALSTLARTEPAVRGRTVVATMAAAGAAGAQESHADLRTALTAVGRLWTAGVDVDWDALAPAADTPVRRTGLPGTPFRRRRYWADAHAVPATAFAAELVVAVPGAADPAVHDPAAADPATPGTDLAAPRAADPRPDLSTAWVAPATPLQRCVAAVWEDLLGVAPVGLHDAFVELGGHSLLATKVVSRLRRETGVELPLRRLVDAATVEAVAALVEELGGRAPGDAAAGADEDADDLPRAVPDPEHLHEAFPLSEIQQVQWLGRMSTFALGEVGAHMYWEVDGTTLDLPRLEAALHRLVDRHAMLRAVIREDGLQQVLPHVEPYRIGVTDLRDVPAAEREQHLADMRTALSHEMRPLDRWPLFDVRAVQLPGGVTRLFLGFELVMADMGSVRILLRDWRAMYEDPARELPALGLSFRDYQLASARMKETERYRRSLAYWRERVAQLPPAPDLPLAVAPEEVRTPRFSPRTARIQREVWDRVTARAARHGLTPSTVLLASYALVLGRWSRTAAFTLNVTSNVRLPVHEDVEQIAGGFASFGLLPVDLADRPTVLQVARALQEQSWQDLEHRWVNGVEVLRELARVRGDGSGALMPVVFTSTLVNSVGEDRTSMVDWLGDLAHEIIQTPQVWLDAAALEVEAGLVVGFPAVDGLFREGVVDAMFAAYRALLEALGDPDGGAWDAAPDLLPAGDREVVEAANATAGTVPDGLLHTRLIDHAVRTPEAVAVVDAAGPVTYRDLHERACGLAWQLRDLGVGPGQRVAVTVDKSAEQVVAALAVLLTGAAYLPVDASAPAARQDQVVGLGGCRVVVVAQDDDRARPAGVTAVPVLAGAGAPRRHDAPRALVEPGDTAYVIYTSGSTGLPKGVVVSHRAAVNTCVDVDERFGVGPGDAVLGLSSLGFDLSVWDVFGVLGAGGTLVLPEPAARRDPARWLELVRTHGVTLWNSVPALMQMLVEHVEGGADAGLGGLRLSLLSGDWIPVDLPDRLRAVAPACRVVSLGGATEAGIWSVLHEVDEVDPAWDSIPYGRPLRNQTLHVLDDRMQECPVEVTGDLYIGGTGLADGYWDDPERTAAAFVTHPVTGRRLYRTGDLARRGPDGTLEFLGRVDLQVKVGGYRIELGEIEAVLQRHPAVLGAVAAAVGERHHRRLVAGVVLAPDAGGPDADPPAVAAGVLAHVATVLPHYMVPGALEVLDALPLSANGKVDRSRLAALVAGGGAPAAPAVRPDLTPAALRIAELAREVLGAAEVDPYASFFDLGGDSIAGVRVVNRASREGVPVVLHDLFEATSIAELGVLVEERARHGAAACGGGTVALTPLQDAVLAGASGGTAPGAFRVELPVSADVCPDVARAAFRHLLDAHDALRLRVVADGDGARQAVAPAADEDDYVALVELGVLDPQARPAAAEEVVAQLHDELDTVHGPATKLVLLDRGSQGRSLVWVLSELVVDAPSCRLLADALARTVVTLVRGEQVVPALPEDAFTSWAGALPDVPRHPLPVGADATAVASVGWEADASAALLDGAWAAHRAEPTHVLLAAVDRLGAGLRVDLVVDGRDAVPAGALHRTAGPFGWTAAVPAGGDPGAGDGPDVAGWLAAAKHRARAAVAAAGAAGDPPGDVLLRVVDGRGLTGAGAPGSAAPDASDATAGPVLDVLPGAVRTHPVVVTAVLTGHGLRLSVAAADVDAAGAAASALAAALTDLAAGCTAADGTAGVTAGDFPMSGLDDDELTGLLAALTQDGAR
ncbi:non-ribosomal peptide synthetase/type I polyketide synthase [Cellulomonas shaoxiangyii]|uniref:non-ribosomal peptide synthetase/type I polyketide synthase n=1 Tax=Cellulomonas shaoxiangyii TaxID=2566013 RepID=UPI001AA09387|nr:non-ribosomal peptide synthetase/type I polyketide synthase [Cellulomonas shaoxiangyii]